jgi:hypothetical protein
VARSLVVAEGSGTTTAPAAGGGALRRVLIPTLSLVALLALWQLGAMTAGNPRLMEYRR